MTTLTGFKWLARAGGAELVFAYEEAIGYAVDLDDVRDKDGISAALMAAEMAAALKRTGRTLIDRLDELACELGLFATRQLSVRHTDPRAGSECSNGCSPRRLRSSAANACMAHTISAIPVAAFRRPKGSGSTLPAAGSSCVPAAPNRS